MRRAQPEKSDGKPKDHVAYVGMRWNDAAKYSAKAKDLRYVAAWIAAETGAVDAALAIEADRIESVADAIRTQCESLAGWQEWKAANIDEVDSLFDSFAPDAE